MSLENGQRLSHYVILEQSAREAWVLSRRRKMFA